MRHFMNCCLLAAMGLVGASAAWPQDRGLAERRVALVIGNASYKSAPLQNPVNDSRGVARALRSLGFEVIERQNLSREAFSGVVREFGDKLRGATVGLFYFAGHGLQVKGRNFLVPVDADIAREVEVQYRSFDVGEVLDKMDSARTPVNLVVLDACRNNPFARSFKSSQSGLAQMDAPAGTLIAFATAPGSVAQDGDSAGNGLYTGAYLEQYPQGRFASLARLRSAAPTPSAIAPAVTAQAARDSAALATAAPALAMASPGAQPGAATAPRSGIVRWKQGSGERTLDLGSAHVVSVQAMSPEGLYLAAVASDSVHWIDALRATVVRTSRAFEQGSSAADVVATEARFSPDGRWLLLRLERGKQVSHSLVDVGSGQVLWDKPSKTARFEPDAARLQLQTAQGANETLHRRGLRQSSMPQPDCLWLASCLHVTDGLSARPDAGWPQDDSSTCRA